MDNLNLQTIIADIANEATKKQNLAAVPSNNVWVNASAGTGKTKVLTDRVLRLLLPDVGQGEGTPPENILCITFTKAGASEMIDRVMGILSDWAVCDESVLANKLDKLFGETHTIKQKDEARKLFAKIIDSPDGLQITTIHAFCQSILGRFSLEAGLSPQFEVMEEGETLSLLKNIRNDLIQNILSGDVDSDLKNAFDLLSTHCNGDQLNNILQSIVRDREALRAFLKDNPNYHKTIYDILSVSIDDTPMVIFERFFMGDNFPLETIKNIAQAFDSATSAKQKMARDLYDFCAQTNDRYDLFNIYRKVFLKDDGDVKLSAISKPMIAHTPNITDMFEDEAQRIQMYIDRLNSVMIAESTCALLQITQNILERYDRVKRHIQKIDYDDLIEKTAKLLSTPGMKDWVLYKLDNQIDHILVDEAQDTSPDQWIIIQSLLDEFFSGETHRNVDKDRTVFVVGDTKQSIFSFQGADPETFREKREAIEKQVKLAQKPWVNIPMNTSFRSGAAVLDVVDNTFYSDELKCAVAGDVELYEPHIVFRQGQAGQVDLWPPYYTPKGEARTAWELPIQEKETQNGLAAMANRIAQNIANWIDNKDILQSQNRPIQAGDIMILVRRRNQLVDHLIRALKKHHVPVSGADRLVISSHIAVQDVMALIAFSLMPDDDLSLACVLKSPLVGWDDARVEDYAYGRDGTLWHALKNGSDHDVVEWLDGMISGLSGKRPFVAINHILTSKNPMGDKTGWQSMVSRLGEDCLDPLEELITMAQQFDAQNPATGLEGFVHMMNNNKSDIKRELESGNGQVRIMTVHASKGLQAPIVILPDTTSLPQTSLKSDQGFIWAGNDCKMPLWATSSSIHNDMIKAYKIGKTQALMDEYNRLLYVAMTRAEDRLIVCGAHSGRGKSIPTESWYETIRRGMEGMTVMVKDWDNDLDYMGENDNPCVLSYQVDQCIDVDEVKQDKTNLITTDLPQWALDVLAEEQYPPRVLKPSQDDADDVPVRSPLTHTDDTYRFRRGLLTHSLLQYLPDIHCDERESVGRAFLEKQAPDVSLDIQNSILDEVLAILSDVQFAPFFADGSLAEVPVTGVVKNANGKTDIISGQIDRMVVGDDTIWIVDFKSNRPPPKDPNKIPAQYRNQLSAYKTLIADIYPNHDIQCALLWTDGPFIMTIDV